MNSKQVMSEKLPNSEPVLPSDEERVLLKESVRGFLQQYWPASHALDFAAQADKVKALWRQLAELGLASLGTEPSEGGVRELLVAMSELGRAACPAPLAEAAMANLLLKHEAARQPNVAELLKHSQAGQACFAMSFTGWDGDRQAGELHLSSGRISGQANFVDAALGASHFFLVLAGTEALADNAKVPNKEGKEGVSKTLSVAIIEANSPGIALTPLRAMGQPGLARLNLSEVKAIVVQAPEKLIEDMVLVSRLGFAARAYGAAERSFELVVAYVQERKQFGQAVGRYQAIQHKLASNMIALEAVKLSLDNGAAHFDKGIEDWRTLAAAASAFANPALREVSLQTHHAFGAIGYAEDHEAPRHFKRVHLDVMKHGGAGPMHAQLAERYLGEGQHSFPEYDLGLDANAFRQEVRSWLNLHWTPERRAAHEHADRTHREFDAAFALELGKTGWLGASWPKQHGGQERTPFELLAYMEEMNRADAPRAGAPIQAASWIEFGTPAQQARYLPEILRGEAFYGMWYSEPDSGSDLASIRTKAVREGEHWVINGQKIWTTTYWGDYMWLAARTDPHAKPMHAGISMFVVHTDTPGITRKPIKTMYDGEFCNTFFDDVRVPVDALVGPLNGGWQVLTGSLGVERAFVGANIVMKVARTFEELCAYIRSNKTTGRALRDDPVVRDTIGRYAARIEVGRLLALNCVAMLARGQTPTHEAAITKVFAGELMEQFHEAALDLLGMEATLSSGSIGAPMNGQLEQKLRHSLMWVISLGTNEIQRSLIAQRGLGLPR
jgi:alkylation response protein AidB-like acyl-CoA dehydrogenase